jgi:GAF domain-containing protein
MLHTLRQDYDPFHLRARWLLRLGLRFYYPMAVVALTIILGIVVRDAFGDDPYNTFRRRLVILMMLAIGCVFVLFWRAERLWMRGDTGWLVRFVRPDLALWWTGAGGIVIAVGMALAMYFTGSATAENLWLLFLFPLLYLSERGSPYAFTFATGVTCLVLFFLRLWQGFPLLSAGAITPPLWLALLAASNYYLVRRYIILERRAELLRGIANELSNTPDVDAAIEHITETIARRLRYEHLRVWLVEAPIPNPSPDPPHPERSEAKSKENGPGMRGVRLALRAAYGTPRLRWEGIAFKDGVPHHALGAQRLERWDDLARCAHADRAAPFEWARAVVAAPIFSEGKPVGVLEALSPRVADFWEVDEEQLAMMADSIGLALARSRHAQREAERLRDTLWGAVSKLGDCTSIPEMFEVIAHDARTRLNADSVVLYQLAPGTGYPLTPPLFTGEFHSPEMLQRQQLSEASVLFDLLNRWEPHYAADVLHDRLFARPTGQASSVTGPEREAGFVYREGIRSMAFLPLGGRGERAGALFLNYRTPRRFSPLEKLTLEAFASLVAEQINRERATWRKYEAFGGVLFGVHGPLTLSADSLRRLIGSAQGVLHVDAATAEAALVNAQHVTRRLEIAAMLTRLSQRDPAEETSLHDDVRRAALKIVQFAEPSARVMVDIPPEADDLPFALLDALYCLAMEGIANASFHGGADWIEVSVDTEPTRIHLHVTDNGRGFDVDTARPGPNGIFEGLELVRRQFGALGRVQSTPGKGTRVEVEFPCLPDVVGTREVED